MLILAKQLHTFQFARILNESEIAAPKACLLLLLNNNNHKNRNILLSIGVFNLANQLLNFSKNRGMQSGKSEFHQFHGLILPHVCYSISEAAIFPTIFNGKHEKSLGISLESFSTLQYYIYIVRE